MFKVGDKVRVADNPRCSNYVESRLGRSGTVAEDLLDGSWYVKWDEPTAYNKGFFGWTDELERVESV